MPENEVVLFSDEYTCELGERPVPEPSAGEVLIETEHSLISTGSELAMLSGTHQSDNLPGEDFPYEAGYSNVGTVVEIGDDVGEDRLGERVVSSTPHARYVTADAESVTPVPDSVSPIEATFFRIATISMNAVRRGEVEWGCPVAVRGLGLVGQVALRTAVAAGATPVHAIDIDPGRVEAAPDHSRVRSHRVVPGEDDPDDAIADVVVDATGNPEALGGGVSLLREDGNFVVLGCPRRTVEFDFYRECIVPSAHIIGCYRIPAGGEGPWTVERYTDLFFEYVQSGDVAVDDLVTAEPPPTTRQRYTRRCWTTPPRSWGSSSTGPEGC